MKMTASTSFLSIAVVTVLGASSVGAETTNCTAITSVPYTISSPGIYCLTTELGHGTATSGAAITIAANAVTLDLNGHKLGGSAAGPATLATGIYALNRRQITIRNGTVRGFFRGIWLDDDTGSFAASRGHLIEDIRAESNTAIAIRVAGRACLVRNNQVIDTTGSTSAPSVLAVGIHVTGPGQRVVGNDVMETVGMGDAGYGILAESADGSVLEANRVSNSTAVPSRGISSPTDDILVVGNRIVGLETGVVLAPGAKYRDNLTNACTTAYSGGTSAGNNQ